MQVMLQNKTQVNLKLNQPHFRTHFKRFFSIRCIYLSCKVLYFILSAQGRRKGGGHWGHVPPPTFKVMRKSALFKKESAPCVVDGVFLPLAIFTLIRIGA